ncbi:flagellar protein FlgN [Metabacillus litoralis]|uniref:flagellar protein FlgN n=1 Tax=Metabacillus litoralis TaxID=152268 RepID=UPI000EF5E4BD|nr:flagellar protein FlgN [Metabacillus litoralis]
MAAEQLIQTLEKLLKLHQNLYEVTLQKTEILKHDSVEELKELLKKEQMYVQAIKQVEDERIRVAAEFLGNNEEATLSACIVKATGAEKEKLQVILKEFTKTMNQLKDRNQLNRELTKQALQLTSMTLDMIMPQETDINYDKPTNKTTEKQRRSIFDSKA